MGWSRFFRRSQWDDERAREIQSHLEMEADENIARGMSPEEAQYAARRKFGNPTFIREQIYRMNTVGFFETLWLDLRYALRSLRRSPTFTITAILTLTLGIGANTTIFSVVDAAVFRPLPYRQPDQLVDILEVQRRGTSEMNMYSGMSREEFEDWRAQRQIFQGIERYKYPKEMMLGAAAQPEPIRVGALSPGMPGLLGIGPMLGRGFLAEEAKPGNDVVVLLSEGFWARAFGADAGVLGKTVIIDKRSYTAVGIMPREFKVPPYAAADAWFPLTDQTSGSSIIARLRPGLSFEQAAREVRLAAPQIGRQRRGKAWQDADIQAIHSLVQGDRRTTLLVLLGAVGFVLLIACANVANLLLARSVTLEREVAIRAAIGAGRARLLRQFLVESLVLAAFGALAALLLAAWAVHVIPQVLPSELPLFSVHELTLNGRVFGFTCALARVTGLLCGLTPAFRASRACGLGGLGTTNRIAGATRATHRLHAAFQGLQIGLALVLLAGAGLMANSFVRMMRTDAGFRADNLSVIMPSFSEKDYPARAQQQALSDRLQERFRTLPGVQSVTVSHGGAPPMGGLGGRFVTEDIVGADVNPGGLDLFYVPPDYFSTLGIPFIAGRNFNAQDGPGAALVAIIDRRAAEQRWPGRNALGKRFRAGPFGPWRTVVGVVGSVKTNSYASAQNLYQVYLPLSQRDNLFGMILIVRTSGNPATIFAAVRAHTDAVERNVTLRRTATFDELYGRTLVTPRFYLLLMSFFAAVALATAAVGVYGVLSYSTSRRTAEIGLRIALGARPRDIRRLVVRIMLAPVIGGILAGTLGAYWLSRLLGALLYQVTPHDPMTMISAAALMLAVALAATYLPSQRACRVDPTTALRVD